MPHFTLLLSPNGPIVDVWIGVSQARAQALIIAKQPIPPAVTVRALVDTGASCTCIDPSALATLGLSPTGLTPMFTPSTGGTPHQANTYDVNLMIPCGTMMPLVIGNLAIAESTLINQGIQALLGRDVLSRCMLVYNGMNNFLSLAY
jgi:predicted aspartyl protease